MEKSKNLKAEIDVKNQKQKSQKVRNNKLAEYKNDKTSKSGSLKFFILSPFYENLDMRNIFSILQKCDHLFVI